MNGQPVTDQELDEQKIHGRRGRRHTPWPWLCAFIGSAIIARTILQSNLVSPICGFHKLTGFPCPLCGGTRALYAVAQLDILAAIKYNPLVFLMGAMITSWAALRILDRLVGTHTEQTLRRQTNRIPLAFVALILIVINWMYLIRTLE